MKPLENHESDLKIEKHHANPAESAGEARHYYTHNIYNVYISLLLATDCYFLNTGQYHGDIRYI